MQSIKNLILFGDSMKNVIFSIYIDIEDESLESLEGYLGDNMSRSHRTKQQLARYKQKLVECKQEYAEFCEADFILYSHDNQYKKFLQHMNILDNQEFDKINFYKIYLMEQLAQKYDNVLYLDLDVVPQTKTSFFSAHDMDKFCVHCIPATKENTWGGFASGKNKQAKCEEHDCIYTYDHIVEQHLDQYHWYTKKLCKDAMLMHHGLSDPNHMLANTAIMGGSSNAIQQINFFDRLNEMLDTFNEAKNEQIMGAAITDKFFINNEVLMTYAIIKYKLDCCYLPAQWHYVQLDIYNNMCSKSEAHLLHIVDKQFEKIGKLNV